MTPQRMTDEMRESLDRRGKRALNAYYFAFDPTGDDRIDTILAAVAFAGKMFHHTEHWQEDEVGSGWSCVDLIQAAANEAAS